ncbi:hypothetical protein ACN08X_03805 [Rothia sp. P6271]|uniref:hypothetical protein n=1 Tax=Rothia sp. P6271 TaxID=3402659 RepID=UPI003AD3E92A
MSDHSRRDTHQNNDRKDQGKRPQHSDRQRSASRGEYKKNFGNHKKFNDRGRDGEKRYSKDTERSSSTHRPSRDNNRSERSYQDRNKGGRRYNNENKPQGGHRRGGVEQREERFARKEGYRPARPQAPELDTDVTGRELEGYILRELRALEKDNAEVVAKHLVMAGRYLELDPQFALEHAVAATRRAGRIGTVREAAGVAAYVAENYDLCLRELRTHRRISGSNQHLALLIDSERALGRIDKALEMAEQFRFDQDLQPATRVEIALVLSGIHHDRGNLQEAIKALEIPELNSKRGFEYSPRLFSAYANLLEEAGKTKEAARWNRLAFMTEAALGQGNFVEPEIFDIFTEEELLEPEEPSVDISELESQAESSTSQEPTEEKTIEETSSASAEEESSATNEENTDNAPKDA